MANRRAPFLLLTLLSASACTVVLPVAPTAEVGSQPVFVASGPAGKNPVIQSFTANPGNVTKGQPITFQVVAHDPNNEPLQYTWSATGGTLSATTGQALMWTPPDNPGVQTVMVTVTNGHGGVVTGSQNLTVLADGTAAIGGKPILPSSAPTPSVAPTALTPSGVASASPSPTPTPAPSAACPDRSSLPSLDFTIQDGQLDLPYSTPDPRSDIMVRYTSKTHTDYAVLISLLGRTLTHVPATYRTLRWTGASFVNGELVMRRTIEKIDNSFPQGIVVLQFIPDVVGPAYSSSWYEQSIAIKDCVDASVMMAENAFPIARANWPGIWPDVPGKPRLDKTAYVFKLDQKAVDLGTFELP